MSSRGKTKKEAAAPGMDVVILERRFRIACSDGERDGLLRAVDYLDARMREIQSGGKVIGFERLAVIAALNLAHELLSTQLGTGFDIGEVRRRILDMAATIDGAMTTQNELF